MLLISIQPFAFRKIFVLAAALFGLSSVACFADSLFMSLHFVSPKQVLLAPGGGLHQASATSAEPLTLDSSSARIVTDDRSLIAHMRCPAVRYEIGNVQPDVCERTISRTEWEDAENDSFFPLYAVL